MTKIAFKNRLNFLFSIFFKFTIGIIGVYSYKVFNTFLEDKVFLCFLFFNQLFILCSVFEFGFNYALQNTIVENIKLWRPTFLEAFKQHFLKIAKFLPFIILILFIFFKSIKSFFYDTIFFSELAIVIILFAFFYLFNISYRIYSAFGKGYLVSLITFLSQVLGYLLCYIYLKTNPKINIFILILLFYLPQLFFAFFSFLYFFKRRLSRSKRRLTNTLRRNIGELASKFNLLLIISLLTVQIDLFVLNYYLDAKSIIWYSLVSRVFSSGALIYATAYSSLWPYFSSLNLRFNENNFNLLKNFIFSIFISSLIFFIALTICLFAKKDLFFLYFFQDKVPENFTKTIVMFFIYHIIILWVHGFGAAIQAKSYNLNRFIKISIIQVFLSVALQFLLAKQYNIIGPLIGMSLSFIFTMSWYLPREFFRLRA
jgi:O-antigen/teichoic acid export membrane protein